MMRRTAFGLRRYRRRPTCRAVTIETRGDMQDRPSTHPVAAKAPTGDEECGCCKP
jgi:hypothetical protein